MGAARMPRRLRKTVPFACFTVLGLWTADLTAPLLAAGSPDYHYYYFKEQRPLELDEGLVAILDEGSASTDRVERFLEAAGYAAPPVTRHPIRGWTLFELSEASGTASFATETASSSADPISAEISRLASLDSARRYFFSPVFRGELGPIIPTGTVLVRFQDGLDPGAVAALLDELGMGRMARTSLAHLADTAKVTTGLHSGFGVLDLTNRLAQRPEVVAAEADMIFSGRPAYVPSDPAFLGSWGLHNIGQYGGTVDMDVDAPEAWDRTLGSPSILTMVIDTGVQQDHPDLTQLPGIDVTGQGVFGEPINECDNHGTPVAGILGSTIDNGLGTAGAAPGARIVSGRTFISNVDPCGGWSSFSSWTVDVLDWAVGAGVRVTNNSNGYGFTSSIIASAYQSTKESWAMVHFASAGNDQVQDIWYPAELSSVNAVTAIDRTGAPADFPDGSGTNWGTEAAFTGPGLDLFTTDRTGADGYTFNDYAPLVWGTSFSSPTAAGVAALLLSEAYSLDAEEVEGLLRDTASDLGTPGWDEIFGWGLPNAADALEALDLFGDGFESGDTSEWSLVQP